MLSQLRSCTEKIPKFLIIKGLRILGSPLGAGVGKEGSRKGYPHTRGTLWSRAFWNGARDHPCLLESSHQVPTQIHRLEPLPALRGQCCFRFRLEAQCLGGHHVCHLLPAMELWCDGTLIGTCPLVIFFRP